MNLPADLGKLVKTGAQDIGSVVNKVGSMVSNHPTGQAGVMPISPLNPGAIIQQLGQHYNNYLQANVSSPTTSEQPVSAPHIPAAPPVPLLELQNQPDYTTRTPQLEQQINQNPNPQYRAHPTFLIPNATPDNQQQIQSI